MYFRIKHHQVNLTGNFDSVTYEPSNKLLVRVFLPHVIRKQDLIQQTTGKRISWCKQSLQLHNKVILNKKCFLRRTKNQTLLNLYTAALTSPWISLTHRWPVWSFIKVTYIHRPERRGRHVLQWKSAVSQRFLNPTSSRQAPTGSTPSISRTAA